MIGIINYNSGNIKSVANALSRIGVKSMYVDSPAQMNSCTKLILPGVGSFGAMINFIDDIELRNPLIEWINEGNPILGICLGYQALFESSEENPNAKGLGILRGKVVKFTDGKVPQIGWNKVCPPLGSSIIPKGYYYFVNSYYPIPIDEMPMAKTSYYTDFASAIEWQNITATQFHPEKSGKLGLKLLRRWINAN